MSKYNDMMICDLRHLNSVEAIRQIEDISDVMVLVLPKDADPEVQAAFEAIPKSDVMSVVRLNRDDEVSVLNGVQVIDMSGAAAGSKKVFLINGIAVIARLAEGATLELYVNGIVIVHETLRGRQGFSIPLLNGLNMYAKFDEFKAYPNSVEIDAALLEYLPAPLAIVAGNEIRIDKEVTVELLREKVPALIAGNKVICSKVIAPYIKATATVGNCVEVFDA